VSQAAGTGCGKAGTPVNAPGASAGDPVVEECAMRRITRRSTLGAAAGTFVLPRISLAQSDQRPALTVAVQKISNSNTFEPPREQSNVGYRICGTYAEGLIDSDWHGNLAAVPGLATAWRRIDERTVELDLRSSVRFHDGTLMTADDVAFSFGRRLFGSGKAAPASAGPSSVLSGVESKEPPREVVAVARRTSPDIERLEIVREGVVRFVNRVPDVTLEGRIQQNVGVVLSARASDAAPNWLAWARHPVGTGPYRIAEFRPDMSLTFEAHDAYWGGRPPARRLRFLEVPEVASRINGLLSGEFDFACDIPPDLIGTVERNARFEVLGSPINNIRVLVFDRTHPQLSSPLVRRALTLAIDRKAIVDALWLGRTQVPKGLQLPSYGDMFVAEWQAPPYDPQAARALLRDAGYKGDPIPFRLLNNYYTGQVANAQILVEMWRAVGLNVQIEMRENWQQITDPAAPRGIRDWSVTSLFGDPVAGLVRAMGARGELQLQKEWTNEAFNRLSPEVEGGTDRAQRRGAFRQMLEIIEREDPGYTVLYQTATFTAKRKDIRWRASNGWPMDFRAGNLGFSA
jgi:peptide/nickel transport system substrate-binding protein